MESKMKRSVISRPLFLRNIRSNLFLFIATAAVLLLLCTAVSLALGSLSYSGDDHEKAFYNGVDVPDREEFMSYLAVLAYYKQNGYDAVSYEGFCDGGDSGEYDEIFEMATVAATQKGINYTFSSEAFRKIIENTDNEDAVALLQQFERSYPLMYSRGIFSNELLTAEEIVSAGLSYEGYNPRILSYMAQIDASYLLKLVYYTVLVDLPLFLFAAIMSLRMIREQAENGVLAFYLSAPLERITYIRTQMCVLLVEPFAILLLLLVFNAAVNCILGLRNGGILIWRYLGIYLLTQAVAGICFFVSVYSRSARRALAINCGIALWCILAALLRIFGSEELVGMGIGVRQFGIFGYITLIGLYDIDAAGDMLFYAKLFLLAVIALASYAAGIKRFLSADLPV